MKVLHVITGLTSKGGAEAVLYRLITADRENEHRVISLTGGGYYGPVLSEMGFAVDALDLDGRLSTDALRRLYSIVRAARPDVVQTWMYHSDLLGGVAARLAGVRDVVWGVHHSSTDAETTRVRTRFVLGVCALLSWTLPRKIICCSETASRAHTRLGYRPGKMVVVPNGVDLSKFAPDPAARARVRAELGLTPQQAVCGMVARWHPLKGHATLVAALDRVRRAATTDWRAVLIGYDMVDTNRELRSLLSQHGLADRVLCIGPRTDIAAVMSALDVHVLSSHGEAFGNVSVEAMACGTPAIVTDVGAGKHIVGDTGWVVPARDADALGGAIAEAFAAMANEAQWRGRQAAARARVVAEFGLDRMVDSYRRVWRSGARGPR